ncbi:hypothetical protein HUU39_21275 [candidate division KSB1 bacterium]|nr:hypothetical protein [bacterium]NUM67768.1 hypothetical protein [candidate division KSB1 bacterium]
MMNRSSLVAGGLLIVLGLAFLAGNVVKLYWEEWWPLWLIAGGVLFLLPYLSNRRYYGFLMPAAILITQGLLFLYCTWGNRWDHMGSLWPIFILGPGLGFLLMYFLGEHERGLLIPGIILTGMAAIFLIIFGPFSELRDYWPVVLILVGLYLIFRRRGQLRP